MYKGKIIYMMKLRIENGDKKENIKTAKIYV